MSLCGRVEAAVEVNIPAEKYHDVLSGTALPPISYMSPAKIQAVHLLKGEWGKAGATICWNYTFEGASKVTKDIIEDIDHTKLSSTYKVIEGCLLEGRYKSFKAIYQATPKGEGSVVNWTLIYEKENENIPAPTAFLDFLDDLTKDINAYMTQAQI